MAADRWTVKGMFALPWQANRNKERTNINLLCEEAKPPPWIQGKGKSLIPVLKPGWKPISRSHGHPAGYQPRFAQPINNAFTRSTKRKQLFSEDQEEGIGGHYNRSSQWPPAVGITDYHYGC